MVKNIFIYIFGGILGYILLAGAIMQFYKDDPAHMELADKQEFNLRYFADIDTSQKLKDKDVIYYLGSPDITEAKEIDNVVYQIMFYRTTRVNGDGFTSKDECTPMLFINGLLIAWDQDAYNQYKTY